MKRFINVSIMVSAMALAGCSVTGLDGHRDFGCTYDSNFEGEGCNSVYKAYKNSMGGNRDDNEGAELSFEGNGRKTPFTGMPLRTPVEVMRIWFAPWEDRDGDLRDQSYVYVPITQSRWNIEHTQEQLLNNYRGSIQLIGAPKDNTPVKPAIDMPTGMGGTGLNAPPNLIPPPIKGAK